MAGKTHTNWGDGVVLHKPTQDYRIGGTTDTAGAKTDKPFSHSALNNGLPITITGSTAISLATHCGRVVKMSGGSAAITLDVTGSVLDGLVCTFLNKTGADYTFPSVTGATLTQGPTNGDTKVKSNAAFTVIVVGTEAYWFPTESAA